MGAGRWSGLLQQRRSTVKKLVLTTMLAAFAAAVTLPIAGVAFAAEKKKSSMAKTLEKEKTKKKPSGKM
jgi:H+/Cl- antiporter ClcA